MKLELCAASIKALEIAKSFNFDRVELCQNLENGGLTPSYALIEKSLELGLQTHVLIRPRIGSFVYSNDEVDLILKDVAKCAEIGAHGVVVGAINSVKEIDESFLKRLKSLDLNLELTYHRAFDDLNDWKKGIDTLISNGFTRILSSGLEKNVDLGFFRLCEMKNYALEHIEIMAGGGVNLNNIKQLLQSNVDAIHFSGTIMNISKDDSMFSEPFLEPDETKIFKMIEFSKPL